MPTLDGVSRFLVEADSDLTPDDLMLMQDDSTLTLDGLKLADGRPELVPTGGIPHIKSTEKSYNTQKLYRNQCFY